MKNIPLIALAVIFLSGCKKDIQELPPATQTGANTFGARLNGAFWVPQKFGIIPTAPILEASYSGNNSVLIRAWDFSSSPTEAGFEFYLQHITGTGTVLLNQLTDKYPNQSTSYGLYTKRKFMPINDWITDNQHTGFVIITRFDTTNHIISGTFEFTAAATDSSADPVNVTDGRFDLQVQ